MKRWNIFYWIIFPLAIWALYHLNSGMLAHPESFFGFSESEQVEINLPADVKIDSVFVEVGELIKKGMPLVRVLNKELEEMKREAITQKEMLNAKDLWSTEELQIRKSELQSEMEVKMAALRTKINVAEADASFYQSLLSGDSRQKNPEVVELQKEMEDIRKKYQVQMLQMDKLLSLQSEADAEKSLWEEKIASIRQDEKGLVLLAPFDGVVGNLTGKQGENVEAFTSLVTFFKSTPTLVTGYVDERFDVAIKPGDEVVVQSAYHAQKSVEGKVVNKGYRVVEIPEKFSKVPGVKQYGVEIFIEIPGDNTFLQKEVLKIGLNQ